MTPRDVDEMSGDEYGAFFNYMQAELRARKRAADKARRGR